MENKHYYHRVPYADQPGTSGDYKGFKLSDEDLQKFHDNAHRGEEDECPEVWEAAKKATLYALGFEHDWVYELPSTLTDEDYVYFPLHYEVRPQGRYPKPKLYKPYKMSKVQLRKFAEHLHCSEADRNPGNFAKGVRASLYALGFEHDWVYREAYHHVDYLTRKKAQK